MGSTLTRASSCRTSASSAITTLIIGPTNLRMFLPTRHGFSRDCECRFSPPPLENRAVVHQWMAIVRLCQFAEGAGWTDQVDSETLGEHHLQQLRSWPRRPVHTKARPHPHR